MDVCGYIFEPAIVNFDTILNLLNVVAMLATVAIAWLALQQWKNPIDYQRKTQIDIESIKMWEEVFITLKNIYNELFLLEPQLGYPETVQLINRVFENYKPVFDRFRNIKYQFIQFYGDEYARKFETPDEILNDFRCSAFIKHCVQKETKQWMSAPEIKHWQNRFQESKNEILEICKNTKQKL